jgi:hypothetical protein
MVVRTWHGLPHVTDHFHKKPEVRMFSACCSVLMLCVDIHFCISGLLMQAEDAAEAEEVNDEERPKDAANDGGPSAPCDGSNVVPDATEGNQGAANDDQNREVWYGRDVVFRM